MSDDYLSDFAHERIRRAPIARPLHELAELYVTAFSWEAEQLRSLPCLPNEDQPLRIGDRARIGDRVLRVGDSAAVMLTGIVTAVAITPDAVIDFLVTPHFVLRDGVQTSLRIKAESWSALGNWGKTTKEMTQFEARRVAPFRPRKIGGVWIVEADRDELRAHIIVKSSADDWEANAEDWEMGTNWEVGKSPKAMTRSETLCMALFKHCRLVGQLLVDAYRVRLLASQPELCATIRYIIDADP